MHLTPLGRELFSSGSGSNLHKTPEGGRKLCWTIFANVVLQVRRITAAAAVVDRRTNRILRIPLLIPLLILRCVFSMFSLGLF